MKAFHNFDAVAVSGAELEKLQAGYEFVDTHGKAYIQYKLDDKGRQYPVGSFSHYNSGVLTAISKGTEKAIELIEKGGFSVNVAVKNVKKIIAGDPSGAGYFAKVEVFELESGAKSTQTTLDTNALQAAITLVLKEND
jgi:hypothetical protein